MTSQSFDNRDKKTGAEEQLAMPPASHATDVQKPAVAQPTSVRSRWGRIHLLPPKTGGQSSAELRVIFQDLYGNPHATFRMSRAPNAEQALQLQALMTTLDAKGKPAYGAEEIFGKILSQVHEYISGQTGSTLEQLGDSRKRAGAPIPSMTPPEDVTIRDLVRNPDLLQRRFECARSFGSFFCRMTAFIDTFGQLLHVQYSVTNTPTGELHKFDQTMECRDDLYELVPKPKSRGMIFNPMSTLRKNLSTAMNGFASGRPSDMGVFGPYFAEQLKQLRPVGERAGEEAEHDLDDATDKDGASQKIADAEIRLGEFDSSAADVVRVLPAGGELMLVVGNSVIALRIAAAPSSVSQACTWICQLPVSDEEEQVKRKAAMAAAMADLGRGDYQGVLDALKRLRETGARFQFRRASFQSVLGESTFALHREGALLPEQAPGEPLDLLLSTVAGEGVLKLWLPQHIRGRYEGVGYVSMKIVSQPDGAVEVQAETHDKQKLEMRLTPEAVAELGGPEASSTELVWDFYKQQTGTRFAFERLCNKMVSDSGGDGSWMMIGAEDPFAGQQESTAGKAPPKGPGAR